MNDLPQRGGATSSVKRRETGRWSEFNAVVAIQSKDKAQDDGTSATSGEVSEDGRVGMSGLFSTAKSWSSTSAARRSPLMSETPRDHSSLWQLMLPRTTVSARENRGERGVEVWRKIDGGRWRDVNVGDVEFFPGESNLDDEDFGGAVVDGRVDDLVGDVVFDESDESPGTSRSIFSHGRKARETGKTGVRS